MKKLNHLILLITAICSLNASAQVVPSYVPTTGLIGWWPFNGNATDESINSNNGTINGATITTDRTGGTNKAYSFNNTDITVPIANSNFLNNFSISIWVNMDSASRFNNYPTFFVGQNKSIMWQFEIWPSSTSIPKYNFYFLNNYNIPGLQVEDGHTQTTANYNTWHHVVIKNLSHINYLYLDGVHVATSSPSTLQGVQSGSYIKFGNGILIPTEKFIGKLDDIGIWNRALTDCEIKKLYNSGSGLTVSTSTSSICLGESKVLTASGASNYLWSNGATTSSITVTPNVSTIYTVTTTYSVGCTEMRTLTIAVNPNPIVTASSSATTICVGNPATISAGGATSYTWMPGSIVGASAIVSPTTSTTYTVIGINANGCTNTKTLSITVNPNPTVSVLGSSPGVCIGATATLSATGATSYTWSPGGLNAGTITVTPTSTTIYTVNGLAGTCTKTQTLNLNVSSIPSISVVASSNTICAGSNVALYASGASTYTWNPGSVSGATVLAIPLVSFNYTVTGNNGLGCIGTKTLNMTVNPKPIVNASSSATAICAGNSAIVSASGATSYTWMPGSIVGASATVSPTTSTSYTVTGANAYGCTNTKTISVIVNPNPIVSVLGSSSVVCQGATATLSATGASSYTWSPGGLTTGTITVNPSTTTVYTVTGLAGTCAKTQTINLNVSAIAPTYTVTPLIATLTCFTNTIFVSALTGLNTTAVWSNTTTPNFIAGSAGTYSVLLTNTISLCKATITVTITSNTTIPSISLVASSNTICSGSSAVLYASGASTYTWIPSSVSGATLLVSPTVSSTYTATGMNVNGCINTKTITVTVNPNPILVPVTVAASICSGSSVTMSAGGATSYTWMPGSIYTATATVSPTISSTFTVTGMNANGCKKTQVCNVTVYPNPIITAVTTATAICVGGAVTISATGATSYTWMPGSIVGATSTVSPTTTTIYTVTGINANGCVNSNTINITVNPKPIVTASSSATTICVGNSATISSSGATSYMWMPGSIVGATSTVSPTTTTIYTVTGVNANGCTNTKTLSITVNPCTGINEFEFNYSFVIFPNPVKTELNIDTDINYSSLLIVNSLGQVLMKHEKINVLHIENLSQGIYFIQLLNKNNEVMMSKKFIKE